MSKLIRLVFLSAVSVACLSACGGGDGGGSTSIVSGDASFPLQSAYKSYVASAHAENYNVTGTCSGSATESSSTPSAATFEGAPALAVTITVTISLTNCTLASIASTSIGYYDSNYNPLGYSASGEEYAVFPTTPTPLPTSVKVGDNAIYGTTTIYTDNTKQTQTGERTLSYVIEADGSSSSSVIANLITKEYNTANQLLYTEQDRYRLAANGTVSPVSKDMQYSATSSIHFLLTAK